MSSIIDKIVDRFMRRISSSKRGRADQEIVLNSSSRSAQFLTWVLIATAGSAVAWLSLASTEEVVTAQGTLEPSGDVKTIQAPTGGVISEIVVREGQLVEHGQILLRIDKEASLARQSSIASSIQNKDKQIRLKKSEERSFVEASLAEQRILTQSLELQQKILEKLSTLASVGAASELQALQQLQQVQESQAQIEKIKSDRDRQISAYRQQIGDLQNESSSLRNQLVELKINLGYQDIRSPVSGRVFDLKPKSAGFVAQASEPIMKVVPSREMVADVSIPSSKIGFVSLGKHVDISVDSFPATDFGTLKGRVLRIASNALPPDQLNPYHHYRAIITLSSQSLKAKGGANLPLQVGMSVTANIKLRKVSYLQLLLSDFKDKASSLREI